MKKLTLITFISLLLFSMFSCKKYKMIDEGKVKGTDWTPSVAVPFIDSKLTVYNIFAAADSNNLIVIDQNTGLLALVYEGQLFSFDAKDVIPLPDTTVNQTVSLTSGEQTTLTTSGSVTQTTNQTISYQSSNGVSINKINLKDGDLKLNIFPNFFFSGSISVNVSIPGLTLNGVAFNKTITITNLSTPNNSTFDLTGYVFDMTNGNTTTNSIPVIYTTTFNWTSGPVSGSDNLSIDLGFSNLQFSEVHGDFGQQVVSTDRDSILIKIFQAASGGSFTLTNPKIQVNITNSFGFPAEVDFTTLESITYDANWNFTGIVPLQYNNQSAPFKFVDISAPTIVGDSVTTTLKIDKTNSNIETLIEPTPKFVHNEVKIISNPNSTTTNINFATDKSTLRVTSKVELPLEGYSGGWLLVDTVPFSFGEIPFDNMDQILLRVNIDNYFPVEARLQLIALDSNYVFLDSLLTGNKNIFSAGVPDASTNRVTTPTNEQTDFVLDEDRAKTLLKAAYVIVVANANTYNYNSQDVVEIYEEYTMRVRVGLKVDASVKIGN